MNIEYMGFSHLEAFIIIFIIVGLIGLYVFKKHKQE